MATTLPNEVRALIGEENISKHVLHPHPSVENAHLTVERGQALYFVLNSARQEYILFVCPNMPSHIFIAQ